MFSTCNPWNNKNIPNHHFPQNFPTKTKKKFILVAKETEQAYETYSSSKYRKRIYLEIIANSLSYVVELIWKLLKLKLKQDKTKIKWIEGP